MAVILSIVAVLVVLGLSEIGWRKHWLNNEAGRKFVHITVGTFVAFWPYFLSWTQVRLLSAAFLVGVVISSYFKIFRAIHSVQRPTYGEVFFALTVGLLTFVTHDKAVYTVALLQMSLADGFAAIVGTRFGRDNKYHLLGHNKSVVGTVTFLLISLTILAMYSMGVHHLAAWVIVFGGLAATMLENIAPFGLDNITVPLFIGLLLTH